MLQEARACRLLRECALWLIADTNFHGVDGQNNYKNGRDIGAANVSRASGGLVRALTKSELANIEATISN